MKAGWLTGQVTSVIIGAGLGYSLGDGFTAYQIGIASVFLLGLLVDIRHELNCLNERK